MVMESGLQWEKQWEKQWGKQWEKQWEKQLGTRSDWQLECLMVR
jgi:hypothetical protein